MEDNKKVADLTIVDFDIVPITDEEMLKAGLRDLKERFSTVYDPETKEGYENNRAGVAVMRTLRGKVVAKIKEKKAPILKQQKDLIRIEKWLIGDIAALEDPMKEKNQAHDKKVESEKLEKAQAENERTAKIRDTIEVIRMAPVSNMDKTSNELASVLEDIRSTNFDESWTEEDKEHAAGVISETEQRLAMVIDAKKAQEEIARQHEEAAKKLEEEKAAAARKAQEDRDEQDRKNKVEADRLAELEKVAKEKEAALEKEREEFEEEKRVAQEKEDARLAAIKEEEEKKEQDRLDAIKKEEDEKAAKLKAEQVKKEAEDKAKKEKEEQKKKDALDKINLKGRIAEAEDAVKIVIDSGSGDQRGIVKAIIAGEIPNIKFT